MDLSKQYLMLNGDFITGESSPSESLELSVSPGEQKYYLLTNPQGVFEFQIPQEIAANEYLFTISAKNQNGIDETKNLKVRIETNSRIPKIF